MDVPGPPSFEEWSGYWRVYENLLLGLSGDAEAPWCFSIASFEAYFEHVRPFALEFPDLWELIRRAAGRCRAEQVPRFRRQPAARFARGGGGAFASIRGWDFVIRAKGRSCHRSHIAWWQARRSSIHDRRRHRRLPEWLPDALC